METATLLWHALAGVVIAIATGLAISKHQEVRQWKEAVMPFLTGEPKASAARQKMLLVRAGRAFGNLLSAARSKRIAVSLSDDLLTDSASTQACAATLLALCETKPVLRHDTVQFRVHEAFRNWTEVVQFLDTAREPLHIKCFLGDDRACTFSISKNSLG